MAAASVENEILAWEIKFYPRKSFFTLAACTAGLKNDFWS